MFDRKTNSENTKNEDLTPSFPQTRSEIVVPIYGKAGVIGEIDIDSDTRAAFSPADRALLEHVAALLGRLADPA